MTLHRGLTGVEWHRLTTTFNLPRSRMYLLSVLLLPIGTDFARTLLLRTSYPILSFPTCSIPVGHANYTLPTTLPTTTLTWPHLTPWSQLPFVSDLLQIPGAAYTPVKQLTQGPPDDLPFVAFRVRSWFSLNSCLKHFLSFFTHLRRTNSAIISIFQLALKFKRRRRWLKSKNSKLRYSSSSYKTQSSSSFQNVSSWIDPSSTFDSVQRMIS